MNARPHDKVRIYIATKLENWRQHNELMEHLTDRGATVTYDWTKHGRVKHDVGKLREVATGEMAGIRSADVLVALLPGGRGTHAEIGAALALRIPVVLYDATGKHLAPDEETCAFYHHDGVIEVVTGAWEEFSTDTRDRKVPTVEDIADAAFRCAEQART